MIRIRQATIKDEAGVFDLLRQLMFPSGEIPGDRTFNWQTGKAIFREMVKNDEKGTVIVAEENDDLVGLVTLSYPVAIRCGGRYTCIEEFIVNEKARGKGVGGQLLEAAITEATSKGCDEIQVNRPSELGYPVYIGHGWKDLGKHLNRKLPRQAP